MHGHLQLKQSARAGGVSHLYRGSYFTYFILIFKFVQYCKLRIWKAPMLTSTRSSKLLEHFCLLSTQTKTLTQALVLGRHTHTQPISKELGWDWFSPVQIPLPSMLWGGRGFPVFKSCYPVCFEVASGAVCLRETPGEEDSLWRRLVTMWCSSAGCMCGRCYFRCQEGRCPPSESWSLFRSVLLPTWPSGLCREKKMEAERCCGHGAWTDQCLAEDRKA